VEFIDQGLPILGAEPSCLLTLVDEYPDLFPSEATEKVKRNSFLVDAWLADKIGAGQAAALPFEPLESTVLLHGHCQQKALVGTSGTKRLLGLVPGLQVREVDSGCCGMAGSFGYEHYDISMAIGERVLFPAVKNHANDLVAAPGFSCRHQIADGTGRQAFHPLSLARQRLRLEN
jgi:Fe-S oxidoreductase